MHSHSHERARPFENRFEIVIMVPNKSREKLDLGPLPSLLGYALRRAQLAVFADFNAACEKLQLRPAQFSALLLIEANLGCKQSDAAEALGIMQPNFVALMDELERRDLARRAPGKTDRRAYALELTDAGGTLLERARTVVSEHDARITRGLSASETALLLQLLARVEQNATPQVAP